jgi:hypothetical protein
MVACRLGCDELYERGFVTVDGHGSIELADSLKGDVEREYALTFLENKTCSAWKSNSAAYFSWHRANRRR